MSSVRSRLKRLLRVREPSSQTTDEATPIADSNRSKPSTSTLKSKTDALGFLELAPGADPVVE